MGRYVALHERRGAVGGRGLRLGRHEPEAVRVDQVGVDPVALALGRPAHPADRDHQVLRDLAAAGQHVTVYRQLGGELVEALDLLELLERLRYHRRVHQPQAVQAHHLARELAGLDAGGAGIGDHLYAIDVVGEPGALDLPGDELGLLGQLVGLHHELLDDRRVDPADEDGRQDQQAEPDGGQHRAAAGRAGEEQHGAQDRDHREHRLGRQDRVDVGVGRPGGHRAALGEVDAVAIEPVGDALEQDERPHQDEQLRLGAGGRPDPPALQPQPAVERVHHHRHRQRQQDRGEQIAEHQPDERVGEDEERDVQLELRVLLAERDLVGEQQPGPPGTRRAEAGDESHQGEHDPEQQPPVRVHGQPVGLDAGTLRRDRPVGRPEPEGDDGVDAGHQGHEDPADEEERPPRPVGDAEHRLVMHRAVPQEIGPHPGDDDEHHHEGDQPAQDREQVPGPAGQLDRRPALGRTGGPGPEAQPVPLRSGCRGMAPRRGPHGRGRE